MCPLTKSSSDARTENEGMRIVQAGDVALQVVMRGQGMPILLVHGFPLEHSMWDAQIAGLSRRWRVIAPDLPGFGGSQARGGVATMEQMADDLLALLDALEISEPVVLCGLSMGGYIAFQFWRKHASRLRGLVLCDTRAAADAPEAAQARLKVAEQVLRAGVEGVVDAMMPKLFAPSSLEKHAEAIGVQRQKMLSAAPQGVAAALQGMAARPDVRGDLPRIALPTLVVVGQHDAIATVEEMRAMAQAIPGAKFVVIPGSGHMAPLENPAAFRAAIEPFLTRVERGA
jgi:3-oxoadipate enol-lactonase